ncbi:F-box only protein 43 [Rhipicephalus microplus]|uniref:F-box only protein 43 n=1 Tax=Rhipicephalus microplus TaxID=6941 RepID=UPI003F6B5A07
MARTPARTPSFLTVNATPCVLQSTPISVRSPESGYYEGYSTNRSSNSSPSSALLSEDESRRASYVVPYSGDPVTQQLRLPEPGPSRPHVNILEELQSCRPVVCRILSYLATPDLVRACHVSSEWRRLCLSIQEQSDRFKTYIKERKEHFESSRENIHERRPPKREASSAPPLANHNANTEQNSNEQAGKNEETKTRLDLFREEAKHIRPDESLWPCPNCQYPSRVTDNGTTGTCKCGYRYCPICRRDYHLPKPCITISGQVSSRSKKNIIGSKHSKRQLRRL